MQYRHIIKKNNDIRCQQECAYINVLKTLNIEQVENIYKPITIAKIEE